MTFPNGGQRDEGHPNRQVGKAMYQPDEFDIPAAAHLTVEQRERLMSTDIGHQNERGLYDSNSIYDIHDDPVARNTFKGRQILHSHLRFGDKMYYQD